MLKKLKTKLSSVSWRRIGLWLLVAALAASALCFAWKVYTGLKPGQQPAQPMRMASEASSISGLTKIPLPTPIVIKAYPKAQAVKKLQLPQDVAADPNQQIIASADLKPSPGGYVTATVLDTSTGEAVTRVTEKPRSLFELGGLTEVGLRCGLTSRGGQQGTVYARQDLLRISAVTVAGYGEATAGTMTQPEAKAMVDVRISW